MYTPYKVRLGTSPSRNGKLSISKSKSSRLSYILGEHLSLDVDKLKSKNGASVTSFFFRSALLLCTKKKMRLKGEVVNICIRTWKEISDHKTRMAEDVTACIPDDIISPETSWEILLGDRGGKL